MYAKLKLIHDGSRGCKVSMCDNRHNYEKDIRGAISPFLLNVPKGLMRLKSTVYLRDRLGKI